MGGGTRLSNRRRAFLIGGMLELCCVGLIIRGLRMGHVLVQVRTETAGVDPPAVMHEYIMRSTAAPTLYWGAIAGLGLAAIAIGYFIVSTLRS